MRATALELELEGSDVVADLMEGRPCAFLAGLQLSKTIAERLRLLVSGVPFWPYIDAARLGNAGVAMDALSR